MHNTGTVSQCCSPPGSYGHMDVLRYDVAYTKMRWHGQMKQFRCIYRHELAPSLSDFNTGTVSQATITRNSATYYLGGRVCVFTSCESLN